MTKAEWSGWVQAIGSIGAIFFAGWIARRQIAAATHATKLAKFESAMVMEATIGALANHVLGQVQTLVTVFESFEFAREFGKRHSAASLFEEAEVSLLSIPMQQLPSAAAVNRLVGLLKTIKTARNTYSGIIEDMRLAKFDSMAQAKLKSCAVMVESVKRDSDRAIAFMNASGEIDTINRAG
jgi:hypothetical protein